MTTTQRSPAQLQDRFGRRVAARLDAATAELSYDVTERLRAARTQAMAKRKAARVVTAASVNASGGAASLTLGDEGQGWGNRIASVLPIIALAAGLVLIHSIESDRRASEIAEVDAALLTDALPPAAYTDPGFIQFLKAEGN